MIQIDPIELPVPGLTQMQAEARDEGFDFLETLLEEWTSGTNRFNGPGEILCGHFEQGVIAAVGGLNRDPFTPDPTVGRIRRVYVRQRWRNRGIGEALVRTLINRGRENFRSVRLRAESSRAARLYERIGFAPVFDAHATHALYFDSKTS